MTSYWKAADSRCGWLFKAARMVGGFTAEEVDLLCDSDLAKLERRRYSPWPWVYWASEHYSFGRCYREISGYPRWLPIAVNSDHGVTLLESLLSVEKASDAKVHIVWSAWRVGHWNKEKKIHRTLHPWVGFRRLRGIVRNPSAQGTLVFLPHSSQTFNEYEEDPWVDLIEEASRLPPEFLPVVFCIQMHDVRKGAHYPLLLAGHPVVTFGESTSPFFVERFYTGVCNFRYSASNALGSHSFICQEAGVDFFLLGDRPRLNHSAIAEARSQATKAYDHEFETQVRFREEYVETIFSGFPPGNSVDKERFMREALGLDFTTRDAGEGLRKLLWSQLLSNSIKILWGYCKKFALNSKPAF